MEKTKNIAPHVMACKRCEGKGRIFYLDQGGAPLSAKCPVCNGSGRVKVQSKVIPASSRLFRVRMTPN